MKIDYIANVRIPTEKAHGVQIIKMCEAWGKEHDVTLWAPKRINHIKGDPFEFYKVDRNFVIRKVFTIDLMPFVNILGRFAFWVENFSFAKVAGLHVFFRKQDIIFTRDFWSAYGLSLFGKKVTYEVHDSPSKNIIVRHAFKNISKFVTTNHYKAEELEKDFGVPRNNIKVLQNGVDVDEFNVEKSKEECREMLGLPKNKKIVHYNGHLYSWKGADTLLTVAKNIERDDVVFVFTGGTKDDVMHFQSSAGFVENILILGHQEYKKIPYYLRAADILILPNTAREKISLCETSPIKLFEYMASGTPIIASDIPSIRETVDENYVLFFTPDDAEDLKSKILKMLNNLDGFFNMALRAKGLVKNYTWKKRAEKILNYLRN